MTPRRSEEIELLSIRRENLTSWSVTLKKDQKVDLRVCHRSNNRGAFCCKKKIKLKKKKTQQATRFCCFPSSKTPPPPFCCLMTVTLTAPPAGQCHVCTIKTVHALSLLSLCLFFFFFLVLRSIQKTCKLKQKNSYQTANFFFLFLPG